MWRSFYISLDYAAFGIISFNDIVVDTAPIAQWMKGKYLKDLRSWLISKKAKVLEI